MIIEVQSVERGFFYNVFLYFFPKRLTAMSGALWYPIKYKLTKIWLVFDLVLCFFASCQLVIVEVQSVEKGILLQFVDSLILHMKHIKMGLAMDNNAPQDS